MAFNPLDFLLSFAAHRLKGLTSTKALVAFISKLSRIAMHALIAFDGNESCRIATEPFCGFICYIYYLLFGMSECHRPSASSCLQT